MRIIILGPQGAGKGTQAELLSKKFKIPHIDMGSLIREAIKRRTKFGLKAKPYYEKGKLIPLRINVALLERRLKKADCAKGFILDGFPRNKSQVRELNKILAKLKVSLDAVIKIEVPTRISIKRLSSRRVCKKCGASFNILNPALRPKRAGICDFCSSRLGIREDDRPAAIKRRLQIYHLETEPLANYYKRKSLLREVSGVGEIKQVFSRILAELKSEGP